MSDYDDAAEAWADGPASVYGRLAVAMLEHAPVPVTGPTCWTSEPAPRWPATPPLPLVPIGRWPPTSPSRCFGGGPRRSQPSWPTPSACRSATTPSTWSWAASASVTCRTRGGADRVAPGRRRHGRDCVRVRSGASGEDRRRRDDGAVRLRVAALVRAAQERARATGGGPGSAHGLGVVSGVSGHRGHAVVGRHRRPHARGHRAVAVGHGPLGAVRGRPSRTASRRGAPRGRGSRRPGSRRCSSTSRCSAPPTRKRDASGRRASRWRW